MSAMASRTPALRLFTQTFIQAQIKENSKLRGVTGLCEGDSPVTGEFPHKGPVMRKMFRFDDVIMITLNAVNKTTVDVREGEVITSWWKLWDVITYSCRNYRLATVIKGTPSSPSKSNCPSGIFTQFVEYGGCLPGQPDGPLKWVNSSPLDKMAAISQTTFSNTLKFH